MTIHNIRITSENLKELTENARKYPSQLLFGKPPPRLEPGIE
jgi:phospholipid/cholesterol/gamma-HCH transport system substrate-binding protein